MGEIELMSMTSLPFDRPSATPPLPNSTFSTSGVSGTMMITASEFFATAAGDSQIVAPRCVRSAGYLPRVLTKSLWPAASKCPAMGVPIMPSPMNPTFMCETSVLCPGKRSFEPTEPLDRSSLRAIFATNPSRVADAVEMAEQEGIIDLAGARLVASRIVGKLDMTNARQKLLSRCCEFSLHALHMIKVVLQLDIGGFAGLDDGNAICRPVQEE